MFIQLKLFKLIRPFHTILETAVTSIPSTQPGFSQENKHKVMDPGIMYNRINKQKWKAKHPTITYIIAPCEPSLQPWFSQNLKQTNESEKDLALVFQGRNQFEEENQRSGPSSGFFSCLCPHTTDDAAQPNFCRLVCHHQRAENCRTFFPPWIGRSVAHAKKILCDTIAQRIACDASS